MTCKHVNIAADTVNICFPDKNTIMAVNSDLKLNRKKIFYDILPVSLLVEFVVWKLACVTLEHSFSPRARPRDFFLRPNKSGAGYTQAISKPFFQ